MFRTLALLCLVAASAVARTWEGGLRVRFDANPIAIVRRTAFMTLPTSVPEAAKEGWKQVTPPDLHPGYAILSLFCPKGDYTVCVFFDDTGYIAGLNVAMNDNNYYDSIFDWGVQGFTRWTVNEDGRILNYWATQQYYISPQTLATDPATRIAQRDPHLLLQDHSILVSGFNRELYHISTKVSDITGPNSDFTKQACIPWMGQHYYYKTTVDSECKADTLFPWFPLIDGGQLIGVGMVTFGKHTANRRETDWFEKPPKIAVKAIVPRGPQCLYDLADSPGLVTMHTYFIKNPNLVNCII